MAWILLNIHKATEAVEGAAALGCGSDISLSFSGFLHPHDLHGFPTRDKEMRRTIKKGFRG